MYTYNVNVSKADGMNWNLTEYQYFYLFNAVFEDEKLMQKAIKELKEKFPEPDYKITITRRTNTWEII